MAIKSRYCFQHSLYKNALTGVLIALFSTSLVMAQNNTITAASNFPEPTKTLTIVVPFAAGGPTDKVARDFAQTLRKYLPVGKVDVINKVGAGGTTGAAYVAQADPDGYTLLLYHIGIATSRSFYPGLSYNPATDFENLGIISYVPMTLIARKNLKPRHIKELISIIQDNPTAIKYAHAGRASASHLCGMLLQNWMKVRFSEEIFNGTGPALDALEKGQVDVMCDQTTNTSAEIATNKVKAYAVTTAKRLETPQLKRLPTLQEAGFRGMDLSIWHGLYAPIGISAQAARVLNQALVKTLQDPEFITQQEALGAVVATGDKTTPEGHGQFVSSETINWTFVINRADRAMRSGQ